MFIAMIVTLIGLAGFMLAVDLSEKKNRPDGRTEPMDEKEMYL